jgi:CheY-like chemotaxis protein
MIWQPMGMFNDGSRWMKKILIVEDVEFNMDLLVQLLEEEYELITAVDGEKAISFTVKEHPDLILMDITLPIIDGYEVARRIKADELLRHIPIIGLSAHAMSGDDQKAIAAGCDDYLTKPLDEEMLFEKLQRFLRK